MALFGGPFNTGSREVADIEPYLTTLPDTRALALQQASAANDYVVQLGEAAKDLSPPTINPEFPTGPSAPAIATSAAPSVDGVIWTLPGMPTAFTGDVDVEGLMPAPFDANPPDLVFGNAPDDFVEEMAPAPAINTQFDDPVLSLNLPDAPSLMSLNIAEFDGVTMPSIDENVPELTVAAPTIREYTPGALYTSGLLSAVQGSLEDRIVNGGTGLRPEVENAIWDRGREREARQKADALRELDRMEEMGFSMPSGAYLDARIKIETEMGFANDTISREIMIEQAKLELENVKQALGIAVTLEGQLMDYTNSVEQRLFEATRYATEAGISIYNARVQAYAAFLDAYKTKVNIYEARIRGELAKVEVFRTRIEAEKAKADINRTLVEQYRIEADVALSAIEVFKAEIGGIQTKAEIERLKVQIFGEQVRAYATRVQAYSAGVEAFRARIGAETSKQEAFKSQVEAFNAQVTAGAKQIDARLGVYQGRLAAKNLEWEGYKVRASAEGERVRAVAANNQSVAAIYSASVSGESSYNDTLTKQWQVALDQGQRVAEIGVSAAKANAELYMTTRSLALDASKVGAQVSAQISASALSAVSFSQSVSLGHSRSNTGSNSNSYSFIDSQSASV